MEKSIAQRIKEIADQVEQLSIDIARMKQFADSDDVNDIQWLSDKLFHDQSKMHCGYYYLAQAIWGD